MAEFTVDLPEALERLAKLLQLLGLTVEEMDRIIGNPDLCKQIKAAVAAAAPVEVPISDNPDASGLDRLMRCIHRFARKGADEETDRQVQSLVKFYADPQRLAELLEPLTATHRSVIILRFGLGGCCGTYTEIGAVIGVSGDKVRPLLEHALYSLQLHEKERKSQASFKDMPDGDQLIKDLDLSLSVLELFRLTADDLRRAGINTIGELVERSADDLRAITSFDNRAVQEVVEKLAKINMHLRPS